MDDLPRLIDDPHGSALGRSLLASAQDDAPSSDARVRAARRLGIAAALAAGASAGSEAGALVVAGKLAMVLLALGGVVGLAMRQTPGAPVHPVHDLAPTPVERPARAVAPAAQPDRVPAPSPAAVERPVAVSQTAPASVPSRGAPGAKPPAPASRSRAATTGAPRPVPAVTTEAPPTEPVPEIAAAPAPDTPAPEPTAEAATPAPAAPSEAPAGPSRLAAEVALIDRARGGLGAGDYPAALAALAEYHRRFPRGDLDAEAEMVMIDIVIAQRDIARARTLGTEFLARFPRSPLAQRVRSLLDRLPK